ncbi:hypothetical protein AHAS_Ahas11G0302600 [Arachis hypogaea]
MSDQKKAIIEEMGFGALRHILSLNVPHNLLRELAHFFDLYKGFLETRFGKIDITPIKIRDALGLNSTGDLFPQKVVYKVLSRRKLSRGAHSTSLVHIMVSSQNPKKFSNL